MNTAERQQFAQHIAALNCFAAVDLNMPYEDAVRTLECISTTLKSLQSINDEHLELMRERLEIDSALSGRPEDRFGGEEYFVDVIESDEQRPPPIQRSSRIDDDDLVINPSNEYNAYSPYIPPEVRYGISNYINHVLDLSEIKEEEDEDEEDEVDGDAPIHPNVTVRKNRQESTA